MRGSRSCRTQQQVPAAPAGAPAGVPSARRGPLQGDPWRARRNNALAWSHWTSSTPSGARARPRRGLLAQRRSTQAAGTCTYLDSSPRRARREGAPREASRIFVASDLVVGTPWRSARAAGGAGSNLTVVTFAQLAGAELAPQSTERQCCCGAPRPQGRRWAAARTRLVPVKCTRRPVAPVAGWSVAPAPRAAGSAAGQPALHLAKSSRSQRQQSTAETALHSGSAMSGHHKRPHGR